MTKKTKSTKAKKPAIKPYFNPGQHIGHTLTTLIVADVSGSAWFFNLETGEARLATFKK